MFLQTNISHGQKYHAVQFFIVIIAKNEGNLICLTPFENCVKSSADISGKPQCLLMWLFFHFLCELHVLLFLPAISFV